MERKLEMKEGEKILQNGAYEYKGEKYDLSTLKNMSTRLENEMRTGQDENIYSEEILTIAIQMLKNANVAIVRDTQETPLKNENLKAIMEKQNSLSRNGYVKSPQYVLSHSEKANEYILALKEEMLKQKELDEKTLETEKKEFESKIPNISGESER
ncbi:MAG: hypothetical protein IKG42_03935 [Clostridia bacterium]|nr:hypothetical protein [Clostridia bacterium]